MPEKLLRLKDVQERVPYSRAQLYALMSENQFPKAIAIGLRAVAWRESEIDAWISSKIVAAGGKPLAPQLAETA
jgi:prophage regulatory protein